MLSITLSRYAATSSLDRLTLVLRPGIEIERPRIYSSETGPWRSLPSRRLLCLQNDLEGSSLESIANYRHSLDLRSCSSAHRISFSGQECFLPRSSAWPLGKWLAKRRSSIGFHYRSILESPCFHFESPFAGFPPPIHLCYRSVSSLVDLGIVQALLTSILVNGKYPCPFCIVVHWQVEQLILLRKRVGNCCP